ncbi:hypothetical protein HWV62_7768 [Athelia sp. TMB]|nr:hypothetical protein HWV62_9467 [Athelia sp. TMB]KAF7985176.1 hypothetical protein HWV62_7768 [Athelia sp. TMB]
MDDGVSVPDSAKSVTRPRTTPAQRIQAIQSHIHCGDLEPHRAFCKNCDRWVNLGKQQTYAVGVWLKHRTRCDSQAEKTPSKEEEEEEEDDCDGSSSVAASSVARSVASIKRSAQERQALVEGDPNVDTVEPHQVLCKLCHRWIKLSTHTAYSLYNWNRHKRSCNNLLPSSRVTAAQRKLKLVNDPQVKAFESYTVECAICREDVALGHDVEYDLTKWEQHKTQCSESLPVPTQHQVPSPESIASTDNTVVASDGTSPKVGLKRPREGDAEGEESHPQNRARKESYQPEDRPAPGRWGWFMMPFQAFMTGFRQGMGTPPAQ